MDVPDQSVCWGHAIAQPHHPAVPLLAACESQLQRYRRDRAVRPEIEHGRRATTAVDRRREQQAQFVDKAGLEERAVDPAATFDQQSSDAESIAQLRQQHRKIETIPPTKQIGDARRSERVQVRVGDLLADGHHHVVALDLVPLSPMQMALEVERDGERAGVTHDMIGARHRRRVAVVGGLAPRVPTHGDPPAHPGVAVEHGVNILVVTTPFERTPTFRDDAPVDGTHHVNNDVGALRIGHGLGFQFWSLAIVRDQNVVRALAFGTLCCVSDCLRMTRWTPADIPSQARRTAVVTGATGGLGFETAKSLAAAGAQVVLTGRNPDKGKRAVEAIRRVTPHGTVVFRLLDVASLASVKSFAEAFAAEHDALDLLVENAGVMAVPDRRETVDGFELQFGTNYLGHFALMGRLLPVLKRGHSSRLVTVASLAHRRGRIDFTDPQGRRYSPWKAYGQSKLAMLMLAIEFQRHSAALRWGVTGVSAHPGWAHTDILRNGPVLGRSAGWKERMLDIAFPVFGQTAAAGALPILYAATAPRIQAAGYYGPDGFYELKGSPKPARIEPQARDEDAARRLWDLSVHLTGVDPAAFAG